MKQRRDIKVRVMVYAILLIVCTLVSSISVSATASGTDKTAVLDMDNVLDKVEKNFVEETAEKLNIYNIYVIIERNKKSRSQKEIEEQAKKYYDFVPGSNNIVIVFSFLDESKHGFYCVYYEDENIKDLSKFIEKANKEYRTEAGLVISSVENINSYLSDLEREVYDDVTDETNKNLSIYTYYGLIIVLIIYSLIILYLCDEINDLKKKKEDQIANGQNQKDEVIKNLSEKLEELQDWKLLAVKIYPDLEIKMIAEKACKQGELFSKKYSSISTIEEYAEMFKEYDNMSLAEKSYVTINMEEAMNTFDALAREKAERMNELIEQMSALPADSKHYKRLDALKKSLDDLPVRVKLKINNRERTEFYKKWFEARKDYAAEHGCLD